MNCSLRLRALARTLATASALPLSCLLGGCGDAGAQAVIEVSEAELPCASSAPGEPWESTAWPDGSGACPWLRFEGRRTYRIAHGLGRAPRSVLVYLSFEEDGTSSAPSAGDMSRILTANDAFVELRNGVNQDFYLRVVLD
ncbi:MAG: hypothetical protein KF901_09205 [Myxococcales bacterium]|nr:hypothetical protein [Myxococcales bacterium]